MLKLTNVVASYGNIQALKEVSLHVPEGKIVSLIGANGAGKTTTMRSITGTLKASAGDILFDGESIKGLAPHQIVKRGISLVPEGRQILQSMTVLENLEMGAYQRRDNEVHEDMEKIFEQFPILKERRSQLGGTLSGGQQQMLAIGRAIMARPKLLLLDEPSMGLAPLVVQEIFEVVQKIAQTGTTIMLVEQNAKKALSIADYAYVMETGQIVLEGPAQEVAADPRVLDAYLGGSKKK